MKAVVAFALTLTWAQYAWAQSISVAGQMNVIAQAHPAFPARYTGTNSFKPASEHAVSRVLTLYTGVRIPRGWEFRFDVESAGGRGLSDALGLAGFTNLDVVRNPTLGSRPYIARAIVHKTIALSERRIELRAGKLSMVDFFDVNGVGSDSHLQFTNWTIDNNGAYDYAADTRGYTYGAIAEYHARRWSIRGAEALMPTVANGITLEWNVSRARGENVELEWRAIPRTVLRVVGFVNHANMGSYSEAIQAFEHGGGQAPDVVAYRRQGRMKGGLGINAEYDTGAGIRLFGRTGWNSGDSESYAYTEVNNTVAGGLDVSGAPWRRAGDRVGVAVVSNGLSSPHRAYLRLGGLGFLLGDGALRYGRETIVEGYYTAHLWRRLFVSGGGTYVVNPGYNRDRGPALVETARVHLDL